MGPPSWAFQVENFASPPDEDLICSICMNVLNNAVECSCQHVFCKGCINKWLDYQDTCPVCRKKVGDTRAVPPVLTNIIMKMKIICNNQKLGCEVIFRLEEWDSHLKVCLYEEVECLLGCSETYLRKDEDSHVCPKKASKSDDDDSSAGEECADNPHDKYVCSLPKDIKARNPFAKVPSDSSSYGRFTFICGQHGRNGHSVEPCTCLTNTSGSSRLVNNSSDKTPSPTCSLTRPRLTPQRIVQNQRRSSEASSSTLARTDRQYLVPVRRCPSLSSTNSVTSEGLIAMRESYRASRNVQAMCFVADALFQFMNTSPDCSNKSFEELRYEEYTSKREGSEQACSSPVSVNGNSSSPTTCPSITCGSPLKCIPTERIKITIRCHEKIHSHLQMYGHKSFEELRYEDYCAGRKGAASLERTTTAAS